MKNSVGILAGAAIAGVIATTAVAQMPAFGGDEDVDFADALWQVMQSRGVGGVDGDGAIVAFPYEGTDPHGAILETFYLDAEVNGESGTLIVKRNYGPGDATAEAVLSNPAEHLGAITVMFQRDGYAPDSGNWFWARYQPDGAVAQTEDGVAMAGLVGGCISCHVDASGDDYVFTTDVGG